MATWAKTDTDGYTVYTATINSGDTATDILEVPPTSKVSIGIKVGVGESLTLAVSMAQDPEDENMITANSGIGADYEDGFTAPIRGLKVSGASTNPNNIYVLVVDEAF
jgi:hypothetical protein